MPILAIIIAAVIVFGVAGGVAFAATSKDVEVNDYEAVWNDYDGLFKKWASVYEIPWYWLKGICLNETLLGTVPSVIAGTASDDGLSYGIMQLQLDTASQYADKVASISDLNNKEFSIMTAAKYVYHLSNLFNGDEHSVIISYNQGEGKTLAGHDYTKDYYDRFTRWKQKIESREGLA